MSIREEIITAMHQHQQSHILAGAEQPTEEFCGKSADVGLPVGTILFISLSRLHMCADGDLLKYLGAWWEL